MDSLIEYNLRGNHSVWQHLINDHLNNHIAHAYLFSGPVGIGKALTAKAYIKYLVQADKFLAKRIDENNFIDLLYISKQDQGEITIDNIRKAHDFFNQTPAEGKYKFVIIDGAEELNLNAANALLKILEEPKPNTHLFLISHAAYKLLPTIRSRCQNIKFKPLEIQGSEMEDFIAGSAGRVALCEEMEAPTIYYNMLKLLENNDIVAFNKFADPLAKNHQQWDLVKNLLLFIVSQCIKGKVTITKEKSIDSWFKVYDDLQQIFKKTDTYNLDRKQILLTTMDSIRNG